MLDCKCDCLNDTIIINNKAYTVKSDSWVNSYLCDFMACREDNAEEKAVNNPAAVTQGFSLVHDGTQAVVYLINESDGNNSRTKIMLIDLTTFTILDVVERDTATDYPERRLNHANGGTNYVDSQNYHYSVTAANGFAFSTVIRNNKISNNTCSKQLKRVDDNGYIDNMPDTTFITYDPITQYWYTGYAGNIYRSVSKSPTTIPDTYKYLFNTGMYTTNPNGIQSLRNQGSMTVNQSACVRDGVLYAVVSAPAMFIAFNVDETRGEVGDIIGVHNFHEYATGHVGIENECLNWSDYLNCFVTNTNGRYIDEYSTATGTTGKAQRLYNHITLWAVGNTVGESTPQAYSTTIGNFTVQSGAPRHIYCTLDPDIMADGYKIGEKIRHDGYADTPFRSIGEAFAFSTFLKTQTAHQTVYIDFNGDFGKYVRPMTVHHNATFILTNGSSLPSLTVYPNISLSIDCDSDSSTGYINSVVLRRGARMSTQNVHYNRIEARAGSSLTGNGFGNCALYANGQNLISIGGTDNNFTGTIHGAVVYINGGYSNLEFTDCVNLKTLTTLTQQTAPTVGE